MSCLIWRISFLIFLIFNLNVVYVNHLSVWVCMCSPSPPSTHSVCKQKLSERYFDYLEEVPSTLRSGWDEALHILSLQWALRPERSDSTFLMLILASSQPHNNLLSSQGGWEGKIVWHFKMFLRSSIYSFRGGLAIVSCAFLHTLGSARTTPHRALLVRESSALSRDLCSGRIWWVFVVVGLRQWSISSQKCLWT